MVSICKVKSMIYRSLTYTKKPAIDGRLSEMDFHLFSAHTVLPSNRVTLLIKLLLSVMSGV